jgi:hypothetical protein
LAGSFGLGIAKAEFNYESYKPYSIAKAIVDHPHIPEADWTIEAGSFKYRVSVVYTGRQRNIKPDVKTLIEKWGKALGKNTSFVSLFKHEVLVREAAKEYWLPIQEPLLPSVSAELKAGSQVDFYIARVGSTKKEWVFIINEFEAR